MSLPVPAGPADITGDWLGAALGRDIGEFSLTRIGEDQGFTGGGLFRLNFADCDSLIAKLSPSDAQMRATFARANAREVGFYSSFAAGLPVPGCAHAAFDADTGASVLLLQDLGKMRAGAFVDGVGLADARAMVAALAEVHATWWQAPQLAGLSGAGIIEEFSFADAWDAYPQSLAQVLPDIRLPDGFRALGDHVATHWAAVFGALLEDGPLTVLHRDCQVDNVMFDAAGAALLLDWQFMGKGRGVLDVAFGLISSMPPGLRRAEERGLVDFYHAEMIRRGVHGYTARQCWAEYRQSAVARLFVSVVATVLLDNSSPAKQAWRRADLHRLLAFCSDHALCPADFST